MRFWFNTTPDLPEATAQAARAAAAERYEAYVAVLDTAWRPGQDSGRKSQKTSILRATRTRDCGDSQISMNVIHTSDGSFCTDRRPMGED